MLENTVILFQSFVIVNKNRLAFGLSKDHNMGKALMGHKRPLQTSPNASSNIGLDKSFAYDLNKNLGTVRRGVDFAPRLSEVQPGIS